MKKNYLDKLPEAVYHGMENIRPGQTVLAATSGDRALTNCLIVKGLPQPSMTIGIQGRGTLNIPMDEFEHLLSAMITLHTAMNEPMTIDPVTPGDAYDLGIKLPGQG